MTEDVERLRRELRAMAAVNRQLQAQLEEPAGVRRERRWPLGVSWIEQLASLGASDPELVRQSDGAVFVVEGDRKRAVRSGILAAALEATIGPPRAAGDDEMNRLVEGVPVEMFETSSGAPFLVLGGKRYNLRGAPLTFPVENRHASGFAEADEVNVAAANVARRRFEDAMSGQAQINRARETLASKGAMGAAKAMARRVGSRAKRALRG